MKQKVVGNGRYITNDTMKQMVLGVPNKPDARMITTLDIVLVPSHFEDGIMAIEQEMKQSAEAVETLSARTKNWNVTSAALVALTSAIGPQKRS